VLWFSGWLVEQGAVPRRLLIEITTSIHRNDYLTRQLLHKWGGSFGVKGISRDKKTREIVSKPHVYTNDELVTDLAEQIVERIKAKSSKRYPQGTVLIVDCRPNSPILDHEWNDAVERVIQAGVHLAFREVFLLEPIGFRWRTLYGLETSARRRKSK
jgi:hypothetical protein